jgi:aryl-alcohol dehydrogenase-like predicted oxidoreductase
VLEQPAVSSVIVGVRTTEHLRDNVGATGWSLVGEPLQRLNEVSRLPDRYPESFEKVMRERRDSAVDMPSL